jgi:NADH-quinone oxidoreductase subunit L
MTPGAGEIVHTTEAVVQTATSLRYIPFFPFLGMLIHVFAGRFLGRTGVNVVACGVIAASFLLAFNAFLTVAGAPAGTALVDNLYTWFAVGDLSIDVSLRVDALSAVMCMIITGVGLAIHVYSTGYMSHDPDFARFFAYLNLFTAAMLVLVLGDSLPVMFVGWEGVGLCSYLLIGFWYKDREKATAGKKAFIVNRIGDAGFLLGVFVLFWGLGDLGHASLNFDVINRHAADLPTGVALAAAALLFVGATGKSAQIPLYVWLPDAMAGPTPVSALIHAATMVTAGVYMVARLNGLFLAAPQVLDVIAVVGAATAILAATIAVAQNDIKKVLAYSTVSQLGYMFLGLGVGAFGAAIFHVMTHAFFKALLFLAAGSVIHGMNDEQDIRKMGGLAAKMPRTWITFLIGTLAIAGVPGLSGFFSKDEILAAVYDSGNYGLYFTALLGAAMTAFYMTRVLVLTFLGNFRGHEDPSHPVHESPLSMTGPLMVLAFFAAVGGLVGVPDVLGAAIGLDNYFAAFLAPVVGHHELHLAPTLEAGLMALSTTAAIVGIVAAYSLYQAGPQADRKLSDALKGAYVSMGNAYNVDAFYHTIVIGPILKLSGWLWQTLDATFIDGVANGTASTVVNLGSSVRRWSSGNVQHYMLTILIGVAALVVVIVLGGRG